MFKVERWPFLTVGPKLAKVFAPVVASQTLILSSCPVDTMCLPSSVHTIPLTALLCDFPCSRERALLPSPSVPTIPNESSISSTPRAPELFRMSHNRTVPSTPPLARIYSSDGLHFTVSSAPWCPARECVLSPDRRSTNLTAGCCVAHATSKWLAIGDMALE